MLGKSPTPTAAMPNMLRLTEVIESPSCRGSNRPASRDGGSARDHRRAEPKEGGQTTKSVVRIAGAPFDVKSVAVSSRKSTERPMSAEGDQQNEGFSCT